MDFISNLTNQEELAQIILNDITQNNHIHIIEGNSGTGKRHLCKIITTEWEKINKNNITIKLKFDDLYNIKEYNAFYNAISNIQSDFSNKVKELITDSSKDLPIAGNSISTLLKLVLNIKNKKNKLLTDQEEGILKVFEFVLKKKKCIFICQNIHDWDNFSANLLFLIINQKINNKFIKDCNFIITINRINSDYYHKHLIDFKKHTISPVNKNDIITVINYFNEDLKISEEQQDVLFNITGGNLQLIKQIALYWSNYNINILLSSHHVFDIIKNRINNETNNPTKLITFLKKAALIGFSSNKILLQKFSSKNSITFKNKLKQASALDLLGIGIEDVTFIHEVIYELFLNNINEEEKHYHILLEKCIHALFPSEYYIRSINLLKGGEEKRAVVLYIIHLLKIFREQNREPEISDSFFSIIKEYCMENFYINILDCYVKYYNNEYSEALERLTLIEATKSKEFMFETDYLLGLIYTNYYKNTERFEEGALLLEKWILNTSFIKEEPEMWIRGAILLIDFYYDLNKYDDLKEILIKINHLFSKKMHTDKFLEKKYYSFFIKATVYFKIETAYYHTKKAVKYFEPANSNYNHLNKYYFALINHTSNSLVMGKNAEAQTTINKAVDLVKTFSNIKFIKTEILINNYTICLYMNNRINSVQAIELLNDFNKMTLNFADELLIYNNIAAFYIFSGKIDEAFDIANQLYKLVSNTNDMDPYYQYFICNNYSILHYIKGDYIQSIEIFKSLEIIVPLMNDKAYFDRRYKLLFESLNIKKINIKNPDWNDFLISSYPQQIGEAWNFWGKIVLLSDLQTWSDC